MPKPMLIIARAKTKNIFCFKFQYFINKNIEQQIIIKYKIIKTEINTLLTPY